MPPPPPGKGSAAGGGASPSGGAAMQLYEDMDTSVAAMSGSPSWRVDPSSPPPPSMFDSAPLTLFPSAAAASGAESETFAL